MKEPVVDAGPHESRCPSTARIEDLNFGGPGGPGLVWRNAERWVRHEAHEGSIRRPVVTSFQQARNGGFGWLIDQGTNGGYCCPAEYAGRVPCSAASLINAPSASPSPRCCRREVEAHKDRSHIVHQRVRPVAVQGSCKGWSARAPRTCKACKSSRLAVTHRVRESTPCRRARHRQLCVSLHPRPPLNRRPIANAARRRRRGLVGPHRARR